LDNFRKEEVRRQENPTSRGKIRSFNGRRRSKRGMRYKEGEVRPIMGERKRGIVLTTREKLGAV